MPHFQGLILVPHHQFPLTAERPTSTLQPNMPARQQGEDAIIQNGPCPRCSKEQRPQVRQVAEYPNEQQDEPFGVSNFYDDSTFKPLMISLFKNANAPHLDQDNNVNNRDETATSAPHRVWAPQTAVCAKTFLPCTRR